MDRERTHGSLNKHLLEQPAFEGLGLGDLGGDAFDFAVDGGEEIGDLRLLDEAAARRRGSWGLRPMIG